MFSVMLHDCDLDELGNVGKRLLIATETTARRYFAGQTVNHFTLGGDPLGSSTRPGMRPGQSITLRDQHGKVLAGIRQA